MENNPIDELLSLVNQPLDDNERAEKIEELKNSIDEATLAKIKEVLVNEIMIRHVLQSKVDTYESAPNAKKSGQPKMYYAWDAYLHAVEHGREVPEIIRNRVDEFILAYARKAIEKEETADDKTCWFPPGQEKVWRDSYITRRIRSMKESSPNLSIEDLCFELVREIEERRKELIDSLTKLYLESNKNWSKSRAEAEAIKFADNHPRYNIKLEENSLERIYRRLNRGGG